ncbi:SCP2 sterol-binding domain-containing protein [Agarivorans aestuarii]|uniref:Ubiquinone biosynthesis accessory factor UbiT n=1 Tax=Agarivorans aestuarii TaxID=1563703 RepID=A0ABU7G009_9ALTE|nr:SCP2 sterol-binding domain-containing protein [Agarivorans aestuarii]MEE1672661.1 SCP2 sterol-binding domain-containing protein [Agarivorans aestuarii]
MLTRLKQSLVKDMPRLLSLPVKMCPFSLQGKAMEKALALSFAEAIEEGDLDFLEQRWLKLTVSDLAASWYITFDNERLRVQAQAPQVDVSFSGELNDFVLMMGRKEDPDTLFFQRRLKIEGDTELGLELKNLLDNLDIDDLPAWMSEPLKHGAAMVSEYRLA